MHAELRNQVLSQLFVFIKGMRLSKTKQQLKRQHQLVQCNFAVLCCRMQSLNFHEMICIYSTVSIISELCFYCASACYVAFSPSVQCRYYVNLIVHVVKLFHYLVSVTL